MLIALLLFPAFPLLKTSAAYNASGARDYLAAHSENPWSVMALTALGQASSTAFLTSVSGANAIDYEAPILAITALGQNPRTFGATDYIAALKSYYSDGQIGDASTINDDIFGTLALVSAGESLDDAVIVDSKNFIISHQNSDGGWGFSIMANSDTNMTASAILALLSAGTDSSDSHIQSALSFLQASQNDDGGFPYYSNSGSDSSSTAWVIWALNGLNISPGGLVKSGHTPVSYLESNQSDQGYFKYQPDSSEDSFSAITTAYAVIALQGKKLPLNITANDIPMKKFTFRIEGSEETICSGEAFGPTALDIVKNAKNICGFTYEIEDTGWGPYLKKINNDEAAGMAGWLYLVNNLSPNVGAADYKLQPGDSVLWYYGDFNWQPASSSVDLTVTVEDGDVKGDDAAEDTISFIVDANSLDFGKLNPGSSAAKNITLSNNGASDIHIEALVGGDSLFTENLDLNNVSWKNFETDIVQAGSRDVNVKLSVPAGYSDGSGAKSAQLTFWAVAE